MKSIIILIVLCIFNTSYSQQIKVVNINPDKNGDPWLVGGYEEDTVTKEMSRSEMDHILSQIGKSRIRRRNARTINTPTDVPASVVLPERVDNSETRWSRPFFNQNGGSCGSAALISRVAAYEINCYHRKDGSLPENIFPSHWTWLLTYGGSDKWNMLMTMGCPGADDYEGETYSRKYGWSGITYNSQFGWMTGYDKWYKAMFKRIGSKRLVKIKNLRDLDIIKYWIYNHWGDTSYPDGGIVGAGCAITGSKYSKIEEDGNYKDKYYMTDWGPRYDHAISYVGYDDNFEADLNNNGTIEDDEKGALILGNSWGSNWKNNGKVYVPYKVYLKKKYTLTVCFPRKGYKPQRVIKVKMNYSQRNKIQLNIGVSADMDATTPEKTLVCDHFNFAGKNSCPMLGKWADGKIHDEAMEFGYDLTDLTKGYRQDQPLKYFLYINPKSDSEGQGVVNSVSVIDYNLKNMNSDYKGIEYCSDLKDVEISNAKTYIPIKVPGNGVNSPNNLRYKKEGDDYKFQWMASENSFYEFKGYNIYKNDELFRSKVAETEISGNFKVDDVISVSSVYEVNGVEIESEKASESIVFTPDPIQSPGKCLAFDGKNDHLNLGQIYSGNKEFTIEFWLKINKTFNYNNGFGPGWGKFLFHTNNKKDVTVGLSTGSNRLTHKEAFEIGKWQHYAVVFNDGLLQLYIDGALASSREISKKSASNMGDFIVGRNKSSTINGEMDELRFWRTARTEREIYIWKNTELVNAAQNDDLIAYYKFNHFDSDLTYDSKRQKMNGQMINFDESAIKNSTAFNGTPPTDATVDFKVSDSEITTNESVIIRNLSDGTVSSWKWSVNGESADLDKIWSPTLTFDKKGEYKICLELNGDNSLKKEITVNVNDIADPVAEFTSSEVLVLENSTVSFYANSDKNSSYKWTFESGTPASSTLPNVSVKYPTKGKFAVKLEVTNEKGNSSIIKEEYIRVFGLTPDADFKCASEYIIKGEKVKFEDTSLPTATKWNWSFPNSVELNSDEQNPEIQYNVPGLFDVTLEAHNSLGSNETTKEKYIYVLNENPKNGLAFNSPKGYLNINSLFDKKESQFTIEYWICPTKFEDGSQSFGDENGKLLFHINKDNSATININGVSTKIIDFDALILNKWQHIAIVFNGGNVIVARNGETIANVDLEVDEIDAISNFRISRPGNAFNGMIDEFRIWNRALTVAKLKERIASEIKEPGTFKHLLVYYNFNKSDGDVDDIVGDNNGILKDFGPLGDARRESKAFCIAQSEPTKEVLSDVKLVQNIEDVNIYSFDNRVVISSALDLYEVNVFDIMGRTIYTKQHNIGLCDIELSSGVYIVKVTSPNIKPISKKVMVK